MIAFERIEHSTAFTRFGGGLGLGLGVIFCKGQCSVQDQLANNPNSKKDNQINVNWPYGSYVPKEVTRVLRRHKKSKS